MNHLRVKQKEDCQNRDQTENAPLQRTSLRTTHAERMPEAAKTLQPPVATPTSKNIGTKTSGGWCESACPPWGWRVGGHSLVRAAEGVKATGAYRSREQLGCYELAATPASIGLPAPRSLYPGISVSQGSSITLISFSLTVWLASSRYNVPARGSETRVWILLSLVAYCCWNVSTSSELAVGRGRLLRKARPERKVCRVAACGHDKHTLARWHHVILWRTECHWRLKKVDRNSEAKKVGGPGSILARSTALPLAWASYVSRIIFSSTAWQ